MEFGVFFVDEVGDACYVGEGWGCLVGVFVFVVSVALDYGVVDWEVVVCSAWGEVGDFLHVH